MSNAATNYDNNVVGPVLRQGDVAKAVADAAETDNPGKKSTSPIWWPTSAFKPMAK
ncbi:hypothetical protein [Thiomonas delicata]|uniref:Uncharacterized protein n=1 Tax=Thiomonas delicata TaxID=364030 RepID=A0A238D9E0_THIDL|nr:hypothetical protein THIARS_80268 [Thiomonas delicata]